MHAEALTDKGKELFPRLASFKNFYLVGGTALALQIGHRLSVDFDMFTDADLPPRILDKIKQTFSDSVISVTYNVPGQLNVTVDQMKMTFFEYPYPPVESLINFEGVELLAIKEIAASKAFSIGKRLSYKDYVDWYFMLKEKHVNLSEVIKIGERKYGGDFNDRLFLSQLASMSDIKTQKIDFLRNPIEHDKIQQFLDAQVQSFEF
ncbi:MAG: nucleotidyl transferase AbiEii/AbiGii toxin family protein [Candidatus Binatia bacterium]|nr:nucleotidyl transferase AbiEii/AbiGii toxin family protein [Candidatus Binatia bacterium]